MKELFVTDLDGTLLGADSRVSHRSAAILRELSAEGALITVATARTPATVVPLMKECGLTLPQIVMTGAGLWNPVEGRYMSMQHLAVDDATTVVDTVTGCGLHPLLYRLDPAGSVLDLYYVPGEMPLSERRFVDDRSRLALKTVHAVESVAPLAAADGNVLVLALGPAERVRRAEAMLRGIDTLSVARYDDPVYSGVEFLEVFGPEVSKASALMRLKVLLGVEKVTVFGDSSNDLSMMDVADRSVAVGNASDAVRERADIVIGPNTDDCVARFIAAQFTR